MSINLAVADTNITHLKPRISVIGVGGGGGNAVNNMISKNLEGVDFIVANTDSQALTHSLASKKIQLGLEITQGLGAGARPEIGKLAAEEARSEIEKELEGANMVFITAGMGGGTGSGAAPVVAKIAKEKGVLTVGVVTKPFSFEGKKRMEIAENALTEFTNEVDSIIVIPNQNLFRIADKNTTLAEAFIMADDVLYSGVRSITDLMMMPGLINLDFADIKSIMEDKGKAIMGTGEAEGENRARIAAEQALSNPLLDDCSMKGAKGVLINITGGNDMTLMEIDEAANIIKEEVDEDANIIFGSSFDNSLGGKIRVSIVVTGIENKTGFKVASRQSEITSYIDESYATPTDNLIVSLNEENAVKTITENLPNAETDDKTIVEENIIPTESDADLDNNEGSIDFLPQETAEFAAYSDTEYTKDSINDVESFDDLEKSLAISDVPQATALFNAIINKQPTTDNKEEIEPEADLDSFILEDKDIFTPKTSINIIEEEPELFPEQDSLIFDGSEPVKEEIIIEPEAKKLSFIDKVLGLSHARKNRKEQINVSETQAPQMISEPIEDIRFSVDDDNDNLDIPTFLRKK